MPAVLRFELEGSVFGVLAVHVREVLRAAKPSPLPEAPPLVKGVLVVRGETLPIYDIRARFGITNRAMRATAGIVVDRALSLVDVAEISDPVPGSALTSGTAVMADGAIVICDLAELLSSDERIVLESALEAHA